MFKGDVARLPGSAAGAPPRLVADVATLSGLLAILAIAVGTGSLVAGIVRPAVATGVRGPQAPVSVEPVVELRVQRFVRGLDEPTAAVAVPGTDAFYVLERAGRVRVARHHDLARQPALDISSRIVTDAIEQGLVGIALDPAWDATGKVFLAFVDPDYRLVVAEYRADRQSLLLDPSSERAVLTLQHEPGGIYHLGGTLRFGPDGHLWISIGDGSVPATGDSFGHGPDPHTLQGSMLRIDVGAGDGYAIPAGNPFADGVGGAPEVWAYGFRNPWAFDFDGGRLVVADVGESRFEEINVIDLDDPGGFYGWSHWEGALCRDEPCDGDAIPPDAMFGHDEMCALIGGVVYRGNAIPAAQGRFVYADWCTGRIASMALDGDHDTADLPIRALQNPSNFVTGDDGELYVLQFRRGRMLKIVARPAP